MKTENIYFIPIRKKDLVDVVSDKMVHDGVLKYAVELNRLIEMEIENSVV